MNGVTPDLTLQSSAMPAIVRIEHSLKKSD
jgi:hypothetical protein